MGGGGGGGTMGRYWILMQHLLEKQDILTVQIHIDLSTSVYSHI